jgi:hypothetical protein
MAGAPGGDIGSGLMRVRTLAARHLDALSAHLAGLTGAAALLLAIADAAEELVWRRTQVSEAPQPQL